MTILLAAMKNLPVYLVRGVAASVMLVLVLLLGSAGLGALTGACMEPHACLDYGHTESTRLIGRVLGTPEHPDFLTVAFHRWGAAIGGIGGELLVKLLGFGVLISFLLALGLLVTQLAHRPQSQRTSRPTNMIFAKDPRGLRGTLHNPQQRPDGSWTATTTDRQTDWLRYQERLGRGASYDDERNTQS